MSHEKEAIMKKIIMLLAIIGMTFLVSAAELSRDRDSELSRDRDSELSRDPRSEFGEPSRNPARGEARPEGRRDSEPDKPGSDKPDPDKPGADKPDSDKSDKGESDKDARKRVREEYEKSKKEAAAKVAQYKAELKDSKDPVETALRMTAEDEKFWQCIMYGMQVLAQHWPDARAETSLKEMAEKGERQDSEDNDLIAISPSARGSAAYGYWQYLIAKKTESVLAGKEKPAKKVEAIREFFKTYRFLDGAAILPDKKYTWLDLNFDLMLLKKEFRDLLKKFVKTAVDLEGGRAMDLVLETGALEADERKDCIAQNIDGTVAYARQAGPVITFDKFSFILVETKSDKIAALFEEWLKEDKYWDKALHRIALMGNTKPRLVNIMKTDKRVKVVRWIADVLTLAENNYGFKPDRDAFKAGKDAVARLKKEGAAPDELDPLQKLLQTREEEFNTREKQKKTGR